jgi:DNA helicase HerA-like ATPase
MSPNLKLEEVYRTEGVPEYTFVKPPNYNEILVDLRTLGKPVIVEGQSGTGKTTTIRKVLEQLAEGNDYKYLTARRPNDILEILEISDHGKVGSFIIDDFHRLEDALQQKLADLIKSAAELWDPNIYPKIVIVGINKVGSELISLVHDIAKRCGIHRIAPADNKTTLELIVKGEERLNVRIKNKDDIFQEAKGDYWLTQLFCYTICLSDDILESQSEIRDVGLSLPELRRKVIQRLEHNYLEPIKEFCRGKRFRATNDPYLKLLPTSLAQRSREPKFRWPEVR